MELRQLRFFCLAAETQNFTKAANYFHIPQSEVSQSIKRLEKELGKELFDRAGNCVTLNEYGRRFAQQAAKAIRQIDKAAAEITNPVEPPEKIRLLVRTNRQFISDCLQDFSFDEKTPVFQVDHDYSKRNLECYDLIVSEEIEALAQWKKVHLITEGYHIAISKANPLSRRETLTFDALRNERFISLAPESSLYTQLMLGAERCGFKPDIRILCDDPLQLRKYVERNMGISLIPAVSWRGQFTNEVACLLLEDFFDRRVTFLYQNPKREESRACNCFLMHILTNAKCLMKLAEKEQKAL